MYTSFTFSKVLAMFTIALVLVVGVYSTFAYKDYRYGDVHLVYALSNFVKKQSLYLVYATRQASNSLYAGAFTAFNSSADYDSRQARAIPVLVYHGLNENDNSISPDQFARQLEALHDAGWRTVTLDQFKAFIRDGKALPERSFLLTFDDGAKDSYYPADPALQVFGYNAVNFILPKYSVGGGTHYYLSSGEIEAMLNSGRWEIGSHGQDSHEFIPTNSDGEMGAKLANRAWLPEENRFESGPEFAARITNDLISSRDNLEEEFDVTVDTFAFPFGEFGQLSKDYADAISNNIENIARGVYDMAFYQTWDGEGFSYNYPDEDSDMFMIKRIEPRPGVTPEQLVRKLENGLPKGLPYQDDFSSDKGWFNTWGSIGIADGLMTLRGINTETGAAAVLDGTKDWENYKIRMTLESVSGSGFVVLARFQGNENFAGCNFGDGFIHAEETLDGERQVIKGTRLPTIAVPEGVFTVEVSVEGRTMRCTLNDVSVETQFLDESLDTGGVGIKIWDREPGTAYVKVHEVIVESIIDNPENQEE